MKRCSKISLENSYLAYMANIKFSLDEQQVMKRYTTASMMEPQQVRIFDDYAGPGVEQIGSGLSNLVVSRCHIEFWS